MNGILIGFVVQARLLSMHRVASSRASVRLAHAHRASAMSHTNQKKSIRYDSSTSSLDCVISCTLRLLPRGNHSVVTNCTTAIAVAEAAEPLETHSRSCPTIGGKTGKPVQITLRGTGLPERRRITVSTLICVYIDI